VDAQIVQVTISERGIVGEMKNPKPDGAPPVVPFNTVPAPAGDPKLIEELQKANVTYHFERPPSPLGGILLGYLLPLALLGGFWYMAYRRAAGAAGGGRGGIFGVGKSKAIEVKPEDVTVTY
jgi:ATP-dependent Zn protease